MMRFLPLIVFALLVAFLLAGLGLNSRLVPSPLIDKPAPSFTLPVLGDGQSTGGPEAMRGKPWLLNVWASWCVACRAEHPFLLRLAGEGALIVGLNYKDKSGDAIAWLEQHGDPYQHSLVDADGAVGFDWGVYGVPETFVIDGRGVLRYKHIGPLSEDDLANSIRPLLVQLREELSP